MAARKTAAQRKAEQEAQEQAELEALRNMGEAKEEEDTPPLPEDDAADDVEDDNESGESKKPKEPVKVEDPETEVADVSDVSEGYAKVRGITKANTVSFMELAPDQDEQIVLMSGETGIVKKTFGFRRAVMNRRIEVL